jgi:hypothetical protein
MKKVYGDFDIRYYKPVEYRGTENPTASVYVNELFFINSKNGTTIKISNELFWKVYQLGPAG